jgi:hypothetical protein
MHPSRAGNQHRRRQLPVTQITVLISPEGKIVYREMGSIDTLALKRAIVAALNEKKPW